MTVAILGASNDEQRYSYRAQTMLVEHGHRVIPISLSADVVLGEPAWRSLSDIPEDLKPVDTVTVYVNPTNFESVINEVLQLRPRRVIFNPGSEHDEGANRFRDVGIEVVRACTLVMLGLNQF